MNLRSLATVAGSTGPEKSMMTSLLSACELMERPEARALPSPEIARGRTGGIEAIVPEGVEERKNQSGVTAPQSKEPRLLDRASAILRARHYSIRTEECVAQSAVIRQPAERILHGRRSGNRM